VVSSDIDVKITLTSWQLEMNEYKAIDVQIEQYWIQMKDVHLFYQLQVVLGDDDVRIASMKPRKWMIQTAKAET
jgi:hypothetical protein